MCDLMPRLASLLCHLMAIGPENFPINLSQLLPTVTLKLEHPSLSQWIDCCYFNLSLLGWKATYTRFRQASPASLRSSSPLTAGAAVKTQGRDSAHLPLGSKHELFISSLRRGIPPRSARRQTGPAQAAAPRLSQREGGDRAGRHPAAAA